MHLASVRVEDIVNKKYIRLVPEHTIEEMIKILSNSNASEGYILDPQGKLMGKVTLPELIQRNIESSSNVDLSNYQNYLSLNSSETILEAIEKVKDFVGESIPIIDEKEYILGIISESDLFNALLIAEKERNEEELS